MATVVTPRFSEESWDEEPALPTESSNCERVAEDDDTRGDELLMQAASDEEPTRAEPEEELEGQMVSLEGPTHGDSGTNPEEAVEVPVLDEPPVVEAAGGVIEMVTVEGQECPWGTAPGNVDNSPRATPALVPVLPPQLEDYQDMLELEDA